MKKYMTLVFLLIKEKTKDLIFHNIVREGRDSWLFSGGDKGRFTN